MKSRLQMQPGRAGGSRLNRVRRWFCPRADTNVRAVAVLTVAALTLLGLGARVAAAYQFLYDAWFEHGKADFSPAPNISWSPEVWPPGGVLSFVLEDSPLWDGWGMDIQEVRRLAEEALASWSSIPTADIRWELGTIASAEESPVRGHPVSIWIDDAWYTHAELSFTRESGERDLTLPGHEIDGCRVVIGVPARGYQERASIEQKRRDLRGTLIHELGHCLGLGHPGLLDWSGRFARVDWDRRASGDRLPPWEGPVPVMLTGHTEPGVFSPGDRIGASLLRPRPGWLASVGSFYGQVLLEGGQGAAFVQIVVLKLRDDGVLEEGFVRFTDPHGVFVVGGLEPGRYVLLARSLSFRESSWVLQGDRLALGAAGAVRATILATPVSVSAGRHTGPITLTMRRGENMLPVTR